MHWCAATLPHSTHNQPLGIMRIRRMSAQSSDGWRYIGSDVLRCIAVYSVSQKGCRGGLCCGTVLNCHSATARNQPLGVLCAHTHRVHHHHQLGVSCDGYRVRVLRLTSHWPVHFHFLAQEQLREAAEAACSGTVTSPLRVISHSELLRARTHKVSAPPPVGGQG